MVVYTSQKLAVCQKPDHCGACRPLQFYPPQTTMLEGRTNKALFNVNLCSFMDALQKNDFWNDQNCRWSIAITPTLGWTIESWVGSKRQKRIIKWSIQSHSAKSPERDGPTRTSIQRTKSRFMQWARMNHHHQPHNRQNRNPISKTCCNELHTCCP